MCIVNVHVHVLYCTCILLSWKRTWSVLFFRRRSVIVKHSFRDSTIIEGWEELHRDTPTETHGNEMHTVYIHVQSYLAADAVSLSMVSTPVPSVLIRRR